MTKAALASVLKEVREGPVPQHTSRSTIKRVRDDVLGVRTLYGYMIQHESIVLANGSRFTHAFVHPFAFLAHAVERCQPLAAFFDERLAVCPCSQEDPWHLVIYNDGITPGNAIGYDNQRKVEAFYWSFLEIGPAALCSEYAWFTFSATRDSMSDEMVSGVSELLRNLLLRFFDNGSHNFETSGIALCIRGETRYIFAVLGEIVADGDALKQMFEFKGSSGMHACAICKNIMGTTSAGCIADYDDDGYLVGLACTDTNKFDLHTDDSVRETIAILRANIHLNATHFGNLETRLGYNLAPAGVLCCDQLVNVVRPISQIHFDWPHVTVVNGVFNKTFGLLMSALEGHGVRWSDLHDWLQLWKWPKRINSRAITGQDACKPSRATSSRAAGHFKAQASECLSVYPVVRAWVTEVLLPRGVAREACVAFMLICRVIDLLTLTPRGEVSPEALLGLNARYIDVYVAAFGAENLIPKHHMLMHLSAMLLRMTERMRRRYNLGGWLLACLTHERKHRSIKAIIQDYNNSKHPGFEKVTGMSKIYARGHTRGAINSRVCPRVYIGHFSIRLFSVSSFWITCRFWSSPSCRCAACTWWPHRRRRRPSRSWCATSLV